MKSIFTIILLLCSLLFSTAYAGGITTKGVIAGIDEAPNKAESVIYPNPAINYIYVQLDLLDANLVNPVIEVRNILGNVMTAQAEKYEENVYRVDVADFPVGYYLLTISCDNCSDGNGRYKESLKFLKQ